MKCDVLFLYMTFLLTIVAGPGLGQVTVNPTSVSFNINSKALYTNGTSATYSNQITRTLALALLANIRLVISANSNALTNGSNTIPLNNVTVQVASVKIGNSPVSGTFPVIHLTNGNQELMTNTTALLSLGAKLTISLKYSVQGGVNLLKPGGSYTTGLNCALYIGSSSFPFTIAPLSVNLVDISTITLQNGANTASLNFTTAANYKNGVQLIQGSALNIFSNRSYNVAVQSATNLKSGLNFIDISSIGLTPTSNPLSTGVDALTQTLSLTAQNIITSSIPTLSQNFDLRYFTQPRNASFINKPVGTYSTTLTYTLTAP
ncbi:hypothetical protein [Arachidicoccus terrestris]|uniref:hypothetical protein n=1 Tax=Arachidicoccus terrestris TaxID=2875539 RepID=UPI001CC57BCC|nr:hypothetical protein [Arachidicoccus terrestris]UAY55388.1 hypothetical protein K9M52_18605 [Arachidicoccus terrestris]